MKKLFSIGLLCRILAIQSVILASAGWATPPSEGVLYRWADKPTNDLKHVNKAEERLNNAIKNPEFMLEHWIDLPHSPKAYPRKKHYLTLREAILLALRYNPNIRNAELDRILQRYQLRLAHNEFELQYALAGTAGIEKTQYSGIGSTTTHNYMATPELNLKTKYGGQVGLNMDNNVSAIGNYNPLLNLSISQPLLRGFGKLVNEAGLLDAIDNEWLNKVNLRQAVSDQITTVITSYRALIVSGNNLQTQHLQLKEANTIFKTNEKRIAAGQLEPTANVQQSYQIESLNLMVEQAENDFRTATQDLLQTIGLDPDMALAIPSDVTLKQLVIPDLKKSIAQALQHNAQYLALTMMLRADERVYTVAKNQQLWQLDFNASAQFGNINNVENAATGLKNIYNGNNLIESAGITLTIPLRDLGRRNELIAAKVKLEKDRLNLIAAKRALITNIKNTISTIQSQARRYELAQRQVEMAQKSFELEKKKMQAGIASSLDMNNTQNQLIQAKMGLISAKIAYLNQISTLHRILGTTLKQWHIKLRYNG